MKNKAGKMTKSQRYMVSSGENEKSNHQAKTNVSFRVPGTNNRNGSRRVGRFASCIVVGDLPASV